MDMASKDGELRVFMVAGEVSGDALASRLMSSLKQMSPFPARFSGVGGYATLLLWFFVFVFDSSPVFFFSAYVERSELEL